MALQLPTGPSAGILPTVMDFRGLVANLKAARTDTGSGGGGGTYLKVNDDTGEITFGTDGAPLKPNSRFVIGLHDFWHGFVDMDNATKKVNERVVIPMAQGPRPMPPSGGYVPYGESGPRNITEVNLSSVDVQGFKLTFTAWNPSNANRIGTLLEEVVTHADSADGQRGFVHPVVIVRAGNYESKKWNRTVHHIDFQVVDWLHVDGKRLLSEGADVDGVVAQNDEDDGLDELEAALLKAE